jgi:mannose-1-phosphate guanylyltransferase/mannose-6-phosphate isomerase
MKLIPVILCGGSGSRLWPLSRTGYPKQLLALASEQSMLQDTVLRTRALGDAVAEPILVCNEAHRFLAERQLKEIGSRPQILLEPEGRNTAPAVALAAWLARSIEDENALLLVLPADHVISDSDALAQAVQAAVPAAQGGRLVTFGVVPTAPETGYGYIRAAATRPGVNPVERFVEKPDLETARGYLESGDYFWNSGMFLFSAGSFIAELERYAPAILAATDAAMLGASHDGATWRPDSQAFLASPKDSIDYAVMEKTELASVIALDAGWSDLGSWSSLQDISESSGDGNVLRGDVTAVDCQDSLLQAEHRLLTAVGLEGCIVIETKDAVLVAPRERAQDVKAVVDRLAAAGRSEVSLGREVFRPWGSYDSLESRPGFQVKRLAVLPGAILSLQLHHRRAEHWIVVSGKARITRDEEVFDLGVNEHTYIPLGAKHRIENPGEELLQIVEVQIGDYLGEDDIERFEDIYGRQGRTD